MTPEKKIIYEAFTVLGTAKVTCDRVTFGSDFIASIKSKITVQLRSSVLERSINDTPSTSCDKILASIEEYYDESITRDGLDPVIKGELDQVQLDEMDTEKGNEKQKPQSEQTKR